MLGVSNKKASISKKQTAIKFYQQGQLDKALPLLKKYCQANRTDIEAWKLLSVIYGRLEQTADALRSLTHINKLKPGDADILYLLGVANLEVGNPKQAINYLLSAENKGFNKPELYTQLANSYEQLQQIDAAINSLNKAIEIEPENFELQHNLGLQYVAIRKFEEAFECFENCQKFSPGNPVVLNSLGLTYAKTLQFDKAGELFQLVLDKEPCFTSALINLGDLHMLRMHDQDAILCYQRAVACEASNPLCYSKLATAYKSIGQFEQAEQYFLKTVEVSPDYAGAWFQLSLLKNQTPEKLTAYIKRINMLTSKNLSVDKKVQLEFALANMYEWLGDYQVSFKKYMTANRAKRDSYHYDITDSKLEFEQIINAFTSEKLEQNHDIAESAGIGDVNLIFIVGMPRSGTSLVEQILASHSRVYGAGELPYLERLVEEVFPDGITAQALSGLDKKSLINMAESYLAIIRKITAGKLNSEISYVTDKTPHNFKYIGLIKLLFPNAKVIHCERNPMDTCYSIITQKFSGDHPYAYSLEELGEYYLLYKDVMQYWMKVLPDFIYTLRYEDLVGDQERQIHGLLDFLSLQHEHGCLEFYKSDRIVKTSSDNQVREPIYHHAVDKWQRHAIELQSLQRIVEKVTT